MQCFWSTFTTTNKNFVGKLRFLKLKKTDKFSLYFVNLVF